jgi:transcriptional regulator with XRE-family HTH domain
MSTSAPAEPPALDPLARRLGASIRARRRALGLTMQEVAKASGISQPFLSQIERGLARPSMRSLDRIAQTLGSSAMSLLADEREHQDVDVVRVVDRLEMVQTEAAAGSVAREVTRGARQLRAVEFGGGPTEFQDRYFVHRNEELSIILEGRYVFDIAGTHHEVGPGDSLAYSGGIPHRYRLVGDPPHRFVAVIVHDDYDVVPRVTDEPWVGDIGAASVATESCGAAGHDPSHATAHPS